MAGVAAVEPEPNVSAPEILTTSSGKRKGTSHFVGMQDACPSFFTHSSGFDAKQLKNPTVKSML